MSKSFCLFIWKMCLLRTSILITSLQNKRMHTFFLILFIFLVTTSFDISDVSADAAESARGWLWGGTEEVDGGTEEDATGLGWISLNSLNCDADSNGQSDGASGCPASGETVSDYGVFVPDSDGDLNGYAWSENVGWISFQSSDLVGCPQAPCLAYRLSDEIYGWARVLSIRDADFFGNAGGYDGWIKLHSTSSDSVSYGLTIDTSATPDTINGYMWTDEFGWIRSVNGVVSASESLIVCTNAATITIGGTLQLYAYYRPGGRILSCQDVLATDLDVTASSIWSTSNDGIVGVDANTGLITGVSTGGPVNITASYLAENATALISVNAVTGLCGNGIIDAGESCDQGAGDNGSCITASSPFDHDADATTADVTCSASCQINVCQCQI